MGPVIVLGMHKSGTTLISDVLHQSGFEMVEKDLEFGYDDGNKMEREETRLLNIELLRAENSLSYKTTACLDIQSVSPNQWARGRRIVKRQAGKQWGFKDPRTLLTLKFWSRIIDDAAFVGVFRHPAEVFNHYTRRGWKWYILEPYYPILVLRAWCIYNVILLDVCRRYENFVLLDYNEVMAGGDGLSFLESVLQHPLVDARRSDMHRGRTMQTKDYRFVKFFLKYFFRMDVDKVYFDLCTEAQKQIIHSTENLIAT